MVKIWIDNHITVHLVPKKHLFSICSLRFHFTSFEHISLAIWRRMFVMTTPTQSIAYDPHTTSRNEKSFFRDIVKIPKQMHRNFRKSASNVCYMLRSSSTIFLIAFEWRSCNGPEVLFSHRGYLIHLFCCRMCYVEEKTSLYLCHFFITDFCIIILSVWICSFCNTNMSSKTFKCNFAALFLKRLLQ